MKRALVLATALAVLAAGGAAPAAPEDEPPPMQPRTTKKYKALPQENVFVDTRAGKVFARIVRPEVPVGVGVPVILTLTPYSERTVTVSDSYFVPRGYARVIADVTGTGESGGCWDYGGAREQVAAWDLVEYLGTRAWSNGKVGMIGASYDGTTANMLAVADPPQTHLATIVPEVAISDWYGYAYGDGIRYFAMDPVQRQGLVIDEQGFDTPVGFDFQYAILPPTDRNNAGAHPERYLERACPGVADKLEHTLRGYSANPDYDEFWQERGYITKAANVRIPVLVQGGWRDYNVKHSESSRWYAALSNAPYRMLVMGQAAHGAAEADLGFQTILHAWFDTFLYGYDGSSPDRPDTNITQQPQLLSKANDGVIRSDATYPPPATSEVSLAAFAGALSTSPSGVDTDAVLTDSGTLTESVALSAPGSSPGDVLFYSSAPLKSDLRIAGLPTLELTARTFGTSTHFTPVLFDLGPAVTQSPSLCSFVPARDACVVSRGFLHARYRKGLETGHDLVPGEPYRARIRFLDNDWVLKAGHRIGLAIMASNLWWATPDAQRATSLIEPGAILRLPIVGGAAAALDAGL